MSEPTRAQEREVADRFERALRVALNTPPENPRKPPAKKPRKAKKTKR